MNEALTLIVAWASGVVLGTIFFGGLCWTIGKGVASKQPALWFIVSLLLRTSIALSGFYFVCGCDWLRLLVCMFGFIMAKLAVIWLTRASIQKQARSPQEISHAP